MSHRAHTNRRGLRRGVGVIAVFALVGALTTACDTTHRRDSVPRPAGAEPTRYLDPVFPDTTRPDDVLYSTVDDLQGNPVDLAAEARPAVVVAHGGGFFSNNKKTRFEREISGELARRGFVVFSIDYRLLANTSCGRADPTDPATGCRTAALAASSDAAAAVRFVRAHAGNWNVDPARIAMLGDSAGAVMATIVGIASEVPLLPTDDIRRQLLGGDSVLPMNTDWPDESGAIRGWVALSGALPIPEVQGIDLLIRTLETPPSWGMQFNGTDDPESPHDWVVQTREILQNIPGETVLLRSYVGAGHVYEIWDDPELRADFVEQSTRFLHAVQELGDAPQQHPAT